FKKSAACNCPVLLMVEKGRLMTRELVVVEMLKMLPAVPVLTFWITLLMLMLEEAKFLEASVTTKELAVKVAMLTLFKLVICKATPEVEATAKMGRLGLEEVPWTARVAMGEVVPMPTLPAAVILNTD